MPKDHKSIQFTKKVFYNARHEKFMFGDYYLFGGKSDAHVIVFMPFYIGEELPHNQQLVSGIITDPEFEIGYENTKDRGGFATVIASDFEIFDEPETYSEFISNNSDDDLDIVDCVDMMSGNWEA